MGKDELLAGSNVFNLASLEYLYYSWTRAWFKKILLYAIRPENSLYIRTYYLHSCILCLKLWIVLVNAIFWLCQCRTFLLSIFFYKKRRKALLLWCYDCFCLFPGLCWSLPLSYGLHSGRYFLFSDVRVSQTDSASSTISSFIPFRSFRGQWLRIWLELDKAEWRFPIKIKNNWFIPGGGVQNVPYT